MKKTNPHMIILFHFMLIIDFKGRFRYDYGDSRGNERRLLIERGGGILWCYIEKRQ